MALLLPSSMNQQFITEFPSCFFFRPCLSYLMNIYLASLLTRPRNLAISLWIARHFSLLLSLAFQLCLECLHLFFLLPFSLYISFIYWRDEKEECKENWAIFDGRVRTNKPQRSFTAGICIQRLATESQATNANKGGAMPGEKKKKRVKFSTKWRIWEKVRKEIDDT